MKIVALRNHLARLPGRRIESVTIGIDERGLAGLKESRSNLREQLKAQLMRHELRASELFTGANLLQAFGIRKQWLSAMNDETDPMPARRMVFFIPLNVFTS